MNNNAGKGDSYRPVNKKLYDENYDRIFRKKDSLGSNLINGLSELKDSLQDTNILWEVYDRFPGSPDLGIIEFIGSLKECENWLLTNQIRLGSMCVKYRIRKSKKNRISDDEIDRI